MDITTRQLQDKINSVSKEFYEKSQELAEIAQNSGTQWLELRKGCKTNAEADQLWRASEIGSREAYLKIYLRGLQAKRGAMVLEQKMNNNQ